MTTAFDTALRRAELDRLDADLDDVLHPFWD